MTAVPSTKPYLIRAIQEWCLDQGCTPYLAVTVTSRTKVPRDYVKDGQIVFNLGPEATHQLMMGNDLITFSARFNGVAQAISIPVGDVSAIYARENGQGMAFEVVAEETDTAGTGSEPVEAPAQRPATPSKSHLTRVK